MYLFKILKFKLWVWKNKILKTITLFHMCDMSWYCGVLCYYCFKSNYSGKEFDNVSPGDLIGGNFSTFMKPEQIINIQFSCSFVSDFLQSHGLDGACRDSLSISNSLSLLKLMSIELVMPSNRLILHCPLLLLPSIFPSISLFKWVTSSHQVPKVLEFQL